MSVLKTIEYLKKERLEAYEQGKMEYVRALDGSLVMLETVNERSIDDLRNKIIDLYQMLKSDFLHSSNTKNIYINKIMASDSLWCYKDNGIIYISHHVLQDSFNNYHNRIIHVSEIIDFMKYNGLLIPGEKDDKIKVFDIFHYGIKEDILVLLVKTFLRMKGNEPTDVGDKYDNQVQQVEKSPRISRNYSDSGEVEERYRSEDENDSSDYDEE